MRGYILGHNSIYLQPSVEGVVAQGVQQKALGA